MPLPSVPCCVNSPPDEAADSSKIPSRNNNAREIFTEVFPVGVLAGVVVVFVDSSCIHLDSNIRRNNTAEAQLRDQYGSVEGKATRNFTKFEATLSE